MAAGGGLPLHFRRGALRRLLPGAAVEDGLEVGQLLRRYRHDPRAAARLLEAVQLQAAGGLKDPGQSVLRGLHRRLRLLLGPPRLKHRLHQLIGALGVVVGPPVPGQRPVPLDSQQAPRLRENEPVPGGIGVFAGVHQGRAVQDLRPLRLHPHPGPQGGVIGAPLGAVLRLCLRPVHIDQAGEGAGGLLDRVHHPAPQIPGRRALHRGHRAAHGAVLRFDPGPGRPLRGEQLRALPPVRRLLDPGVVVRRRHARVPGKHQPAGAVLVVEAALHAPDAPLPLPGGLGEQQGDRLAPVVGAVVDVFVGAVPEAAVVKGVRGGEGLQPVAGDEVGGYLLRQAAAQLPPGLGLGLLLLRRVLGVKAHVGGGEHGVVPAVPPGEEVPPAVVRRQGLLKGHPVVPGQGADPAHLHVLPRRLIAAGLVNGQEGGGAFRPDHGDLIRQVGGEGGGEAAVQLVEDGVGQQSPLVRRGGGAGVRAGGGLRPEDGGAAREDQG